MTKCLLGVSKGLATLQHCLPGMFCRLLVQLAEDLKSALGADSGLGGAPATDYCVLECEQWNSPLYCDHNHTQVGRLGGSHGRRDSP